MDEMRQERGGKEIGVEISTMLRYFIYFSLKIITTNVIFMLF